MVTGNILYCLRKLSNYSPQSHRVGKGEFHSQASSKGSTLIEYFPPHRTHRTDFPSYEECLCKELEIRDIGFERQKPLAVVYKRITLDCRYKLDIVVAGKVILELKSVNKTESIHEVQLLTYLKLADLKLGILINFNVPILKEGLRE